MPTPLKRIEHSHRVQLRLNRWKQRKIAQNRLHEFVKAKAKTEAKDAGSNNSAAMGLRSHDARVRVLPDVEGGTVRLDDET